MIIFTYFSVQITRKISHKANPISPFYKIKIDKFSLSLQRYNYFSLNLLSLESHGVTVLHK